MIQFSKQVHQEALPFADRHSKVAAKCLPPTLFWLTHQKLSSLYICRKLCHQPWRC